MRKWIPVVAVLVLAGCGSSNVNSLKTNTAVKKDAQTATAQAEKCLPKAAGQPDPVLLKSRAVRKQFVSCLGIEKGSRKRLKLSGCLTRVVARDVFHPSALQQDVINCVTQVA